jgi:hypothetical protein
MNPEFKLIEYDGKKFAYHYSLISAEAAEIAREIAEYKVLVDENNITDANQLLRSGSAEWRILILRYLIKEFIDDKPVAYERAVCETKYDKYIRNLPDTIFNDFAAECLTDFFTNIKRGHLISTLLQNGKSKQINPLLMNLMKSLSEKKSKDD